MALSDERLVMGPNTYGATAERLPRPSRRARLVERIREAIDLVAALAVAGFVGLPVGAAFYHVGAGLIVFGVLCLAGAWLLARGAKSE